MSWVEFAVLVVDGFVIFVCGVMQGRRLERERMARNRLT